jgi:hypothetical protein
MVPSVLESIIPSVLGETTSITQFTLILSHPNPLLLKTLINKDHHYMFATEIRVSGQVHASPMSETRGGSSVSVSLQPSVFPGIARAEPA